LRLGLELEELDLEGRVRREVVSEGVGLDENEEVIEDLEIGKEDGLIPTLLEWVEEGGLKVGPKVGLRDGFKFVVLLEVEVARGEGGTLRGSELSLELSFRSFIIFRFLKLLVA
jgi:hypothetical protein